MSPMQKKSQATAPYSPGQAFFFGVFVVLAAALINLLPWVLALRETPAGVERKRNAGIAEKIAEVKVLHQKRFLAETKKDRGKAWDLKQQIADKQDVIRKWRRELRDMPALRRKIGERYTFESWLHLPAVLILEATLERGKPGNFFLRYLDSPLDRVRACFILLCFWVPWAVLMGALLAILSWRKDAGEVIDQGRFERRLAIKVFFFVDAVWWLLFLLLVPFQDKFTSLVALLFNVLFLVKYLQVYLVLRGCLALKVCPRRTMTMGVLSGLILVYFIPFMLLYEEFNHVLEVRFAIGSKRRRRAPEDLVGKQQDPEDEADDSLA